MLINTCTITIFIIILHSLFNNLLFMTNMGVPRHFSRGRKINLKNK
jgi:hypothetical protein